MYLYLELSTSNDLMKGRSTPRNAVRKITFCWIMRKNINLIITGCYSPPGVETVRGMCCAIKLSPQKVLFIISNVPIYKVYIYQDISIASNLKGNLCYFGQCEFTVYAFCIVYSQDKWHVSKPFKQINIRVYKLKYDIVFWIITNW